MTGIAYTGRVPQLKDSEVIRSTSNYPFIVNTKTVAAGEELVVQYDREEQKDKKKRKELTAFDQIKQKAKKQKTVQGPPKNRIKQ